MKYHKSHLTAIRRYQSANLEIQQHIYHIVDTTNVYILRRDWHLSPLTVFGSILGLLLLNFVAVGRNITLLLLISE